MSPKENLTFGRKIVSNLQHCNFNGVSFPRDIYSRCGTIEDGCKFGRSISIHSIITETTSIENQNGGSEAKAVESESMN